MERREWLAGKRRQAEERMNTLFAPIYDEHWGAVISPTHQDFVRKFLDRCLPGCTVLGAASGTGKYWPLLLAGGRYVRGMDQAQGMLKRANAKFPDVATRRQGLQELSDHEEYDGILCIDAMEYVPPEDWPVILGNFRRALKPGGHLYLTVERPDPEDVRSSFELAKQKGLPIVYGECAHDDGYHYYPSIGQVKDWMREAEFIIVDEALGDEYHHFLLRR